MDTNRNISEAFVDLLYELANKPIPERVLLEARLCVLDTLGGMIGGVQWIRDRLQRYLDALPQPAQGATVVNFGRQASLQDAALINGMCAHVFDIDDGHRFGGVHVGAEVVPPALAVCEYYRLPMQALLRAVVIGYEATIRVGCCLQPENKARGFHPSGTAGTIGAAMAVAAALGYSREEMKAALAAAATSAAGLAEMAENVSTLKAYNVGRAGSDGLTAALLARAGFVGPYDPLGGKGGFLTAMAQRWNEQELYVKDEREWRILGAYHKLYASCRHSHAAIDCVLGIAAQQPIPAASVEGIDVRMYGQGVKKHSHTEVPGTISAMMSIPFCLGLAICRGRVGIQEFSDENVRDEEILALARKTRITADAAMTAQVPVQRAASVEIRLCDGTRYHKQVTLAKGEPETPLTVDEYKDKFLELAEYGGKTREQALHITELTLAGDCALGDLMAALA